MTGKRHSAAAASHHGPAPRENNKQTHLSAPSKSDKTLIQSTCAILPRNLAFCATDQRCDCVSPSRSRAAHRERPARCAGPRSPGSDRLTPPSDRPPMPAKSASGIDLRSAPCGLQRDRRPPVNGIIFREVRPNYELDWHPAPRRRYIINLAADPHCGASLLPWSRPRRSSLGGAGGASLDRR
jgi:hypothetical protein